MKKVRGFRFNKDTNKALDELLKKFNDASVVPLTLTQVLEILILSANQKTSSELLAMLQRKTNK